MKNKLITALMAICMVGSLAGCSSSDGTDPTASTMPSLAQEETTETTTETTEATTTTTEETTTAVVSDSDSTQAGGASTDLVVGNEADHNAHITVKNDSGKVIKEFYIKQNSAKEYEPDNLLLTPWAAEETREVYLKVETEKDYDIRIVYEDGTANEMTRLYLAYIGEGTIRFVDGKSFLEHEPIPQETETEETKATTKKPKATTTQDPNAGCIGDDGLFY